MFSRPVPADVALDGDGRSWLLPLWTIDAAPIHAVCRLDAEGRIDRVVGAPDEPGAVDGAAEVARLDRPRDFSIDAQRRLWVGEGGTRGAIGRIDTDGGVLIASGGALLKALPAAPGPKQRAQAGGVPACGRG